MSGEATQDEPTGALKEKDPQPLLEDVSLASTSNIVDNDAELPSEGEIPKDLAKEELAEGAILDVETGEEVEKVQDEEVAETVPETVPETVMVEKNENPLDSIGAWFQGLVKGPSQDTQTLESEEAIEKDTTDLENPEPAGDLEMSVSEPSSADVMNAGGDEEPLEKSKSNPSEGTESETKSGGLYRHMNVLFGKSKPNTDMTTDVAENEATLERKGIQGHFGAFFGSRQRTPKDEEGGASVSQKVGGFFNRSPRTESKQPDDDDESLKKQGGVHQKFRTFLGNRQRRMLVIACVPVLISLVVVAPFIFREMAAVGSFARSVGQVESFLQADVIPHPLYNGDLFPSGQIVLRFNVEDRFLVNFRVEGLEQNCERCAWSIVDGDTCHDADKLGNTLYYDHTDPALVTFNPYSMCYYSTKDGGSESSETVLNGYNMEENEGRAIVLSDGNGAPLACGILKRQAHPLTYPKLWANMVNLPSYSDAIQGKIRVDFYPDHAFHVGFQLTGLPPNCGMCAIGIHAGTSCTDPPGNHLWNSNKLTDDPWHFVNGVYYQSDGNGTTIDRHGFYLYDGYGFDDHKERLVIVSDVNGNAIACGELRESSHYVWRDTEDAIRNAMEAGTMIHTGPAGITGVETVNAIENVFSH